MLETADRVLFLAPTRKDAAAGAALLAGAGLAYHGCGSLAELCREVAGGVGAVVLPEEAATGPGGAALKAAVRDQPPWSDLPVLLLTAAGPTPAARVRTLLDLGAVTLLKRPLAAAEFLHSVRA